MFLNSDWFESYFFPETHKRLASNYNLVYNSLKSIGLSVRRQEAGLFVWVSLDRFLKQKTIECEMGTVYTIIQIIFNRKCKHLSIFFRIVQ